MGAWGEAWRGALARSPSIGAKPDCLPIAAGTAVLPCQKRALLWGSAAHDAGWHAWRRFGAALLAWAGAALAVIAVWGRWLSERQAWYYSSPPLSGNMVFPVDLPWPYGERGVELHPTAAFQLWPDNLIPLVQVTITESPPVAMVGDDSDDDIRSPTSISRTRILESSRKPGRVFRVAATPPQLSQRYAALRVVRPRHRPPSQNPRSRTTLMPSQSSSPTAPRASVGSQHFSGTRERAASRSRGPESAHPSGEVRLVRRRVGSSSRPSSPPILIS